MARTKRAGFYDSWMNLSIGDLGKGMEAFQVGLTRQQRVSYSLAVVALAAATFLFVEPISAAGILVAGLAVVWKPGATVSKKQKKVFLTIFDVVLVCAFLAKAQVFLGIAGFVLVGFALHVGYIWRR